MDETYGQMPQYICGCCVEKVKASYEFVRQAQEIHYKLISMLNEEDYADRSGMIDSLQEAQVDIDNCLEIKMEEEEIDQINFDMCHMFDYTNATECEDNHDDIHEEDSDVDKSEDNDVDKSEDSDVDKSKNDKSKNSDMESMSSSDSDWAKEFGLQKIKKKVKKKIIDDNNVSEEAKKIPCPYCPAKFTRPPNMYTHLKKYHKDKPIDEHITTPEHVGVLPKKRFLCTICDSTFGTTPSLNDHIRRHKGERPFKCDLCEKSFYKGFELQTHRREHTGEKPFICEICERAFTASAKLKRHLRVHSSERPYECDQCVQAFKHPSNLRVHKRIHDRERWGLHERKTKHLRTG